MMPVVCPSLEAAIPGLVFLPLATYRMSLQQLAPNAAAMKVPCTQGQLTKAYVST